MVEAAVKYVTRSWWRTAPVATLGQAQADLDRWAIAVADRRRRDGHSVAELAGQEPLLELPTDVFPAVIEAERVVSRTALVAFEGNHYSVAPSLVGHTVTVRARLGELHLEIISAAGKRVARHRRAPAGAGQTLQSPEHAKLLENAVLEAYTTAKPCVRKQNRPPGKAAKAAAVSLLRDQGPAEVVVIDWKRYAQLATVAR